MVISRYYLTDFGLQNKGPIRIRILIYGRIRIWFLKFGRIRSEHQDLEYLIAHFFLFIFWRSDQGQGSFSKVGSGLKSNRVRNPAYNFCLSKKSCNILYINLLYKTGQYFLDIHYVTTKKKRLVQL